MPNIKLIIQARLNSSRLPGKMLMPVGGMPLIVLCAKRAAESGYPLVVATSDERSDDDLVTTLKDHQISYIRGSLNNVLDRFIQASEDMKDDDLVVRLTGDNPIVNGEFIQDILEFHQSHDQDYTRSLSPLDGFPYGLSAEVITVGKLRAIASGNPNDAHKEHVTLKPTEEGEYVLFRQDKDQSYLRVTVDTKEDYDRVSKIFGHLDSDPIKAEWSRLLDILESFPETPRFRAPFKVIDGTYKTHSRLALGTVQLGLPYGIANKTGQPDVENAKAILEAALKYQIDIIDTASAYGSSEEILGQILPGHVKFGLTLTTKLDPLSNIDKKDIAHAVEQSVEGSLKKLGVKTLPVLMLHRWSHYDDFGGAVWQRLLEYREAGIIQRLGASIQTPEEGLKALKEPQIEYIQLPFNILDYRWQKSGFIEGLKNRPDIHIQARSVLLQGVLTLTPEKWPLPLDIASKITENLNQLVEQYERESVIDLCYAYARSQEWIDSIVIGMETEQQVEDNVRLFNTRPLDETVNINEKSVPEEFLNPANWKAS